MGDASIGITHKELLTFSNLTNLEWEFVDLEEIKYGAGVSAAISTQLNDLLDPEVFVREYDGGSTEHIYGADEEGNLINQEQGLVEMRQKAGIAMEYLEKSKAGNKQGEFLEDWEVIYGGDKYKIVEDYLKSREELIVKLAEVLLDKEDLENLTGFSFNSREKFEEEYREKEAVEERKARIKLIVNLVYGGISVVCTGAKAAASSKVINLTSNKILVKGVADTVVKTGEELLNRSIKNISPDLALFVKVIGDPFNLEKILETGVKGLGKYLSEVDLDDEKDEILAKIETIIKENKGIEGLEFIEELDMFDEARYSGEGDEFRVLVLKKEDNIVITYKGKNIPENKILPDEFECLQMVHSKVLMENPDAKINITGINGGGELSFINTLIGVTDHSYIVEAGQDLKDISLELFGDSELWKEEIFRDENDKILTKVDEIKEGDKIFYCPVETDSLNGNIFISSIGQLEKCLYFTKENMNSKYQPFITYAFGVISTAVSVAVVNIIKKLIYKYLGLSLGQILVTFASIAGKALMFYLLGLLKHVLAKLITYTSIKKPTLACVSALLGMGGIIKTAFTGLKLIIKVVFKVVFIALVVIGIIFFIVDFLEKRAKAKRIEALYNWLDNENYIELERDRIKGYISDNFMEKSIVEFTVRDEETLEEKVASFDINQGVFIKYLLHKSNEKRNKPYELKWNKKNNKLYLYLGDHQIMESRTTAYNQIYIEFEEYDNIYEAINHRIDFSGISNFTMSWEIGSEEDEYLKLYKESSLLSEESKKLLEESNPNINENFYQDYEKNKEKKALVNLKKLALENPHLKEYEEESANFSMMISIMKILGDMQRFYLNKSDNLFEFIYPAGNTEDDSYDYGQETSAEKGKARIEVFRGIPEKLETPKWYQNSSKNEFVFLPFIDEETGNIGDTINEDYVASVFKSRIEVANYYERFLYQNINNALGVFNNFYNIIKKFKYQESFERYDENFTNFTSYINCHGKKIKEALLEIIKEAKVANKVYSSSRLEIDFSDIYLFYDSVVERLEQEIEDYYTICPFAVSGESEDYSCEENYHYYFFEDVYGTLIINPEAESRMEYKYNLDDCILGDSYEAKYVDAYPMSVTKSKDGKSGIELANGLPSDGDEEIDVDEDYLLA